MNWAVCCDGPNQLSVNGKLKWISNVRGGLGSLIEPDIFLMSYSFERQCGEPETFLNFDNNEQPFYHLSALLLLRKSLFIQTPKLPRLG